MTKQRDRRILFSVTESEQLTREKWESFKAAAHARGETWMAVLRRAIDRYLAGEGNHEKQP